MSKIGMNELKKAIVKKGWVVKNCKVVSAYYDGWDYVYLLIKYDGQYRLEFLEIYDGRPEKDEFGNVILDCDYDDRGYGVRAGKRFLNTVKRYLNKDNFRDKEWVQDYLSRWY